MTYLQLCSCTVHVYRFCAVRCVIIVCFVCYFPITGLTFLIFFVCLFFVLYFCFLFCVFCVLYCCCCIVLCIVSSFVYGCPFPISVQSTDHCHRVETQLRETSITSYQNETPRKSGWKYWLARNGLGQSHPYVNTAKKLWALRNGRACFYCRIEYQHLNELPGTCKSVGSNIGGGGGASDMYRVFRKGLFYV